LRRIAVPNLKSSRIKSQIKSQIPTITYNAYTCSDYGILWSINGDKSGLRNLQN